MPAKQLPTASLFESNPPGATVELPLREFDAAATEAELKVRADDVDRSLAKLNQAQVVTHTILELVVSV